MELVNRASERSVTLETTLLVHGVPKSEGPRLNDDLYRVVRDNGAEPAVVGVVAGKPTVGMTPQELQLLFDAEDVPKANTANLGVFIHRKQHAATTVSATMELAAGAGVRVFATGGLGGVHKELTERLDISADLAAFARFPVAVVTSGVKSLLDVESTREALETLGVPVVGYKTDAFPAFYLRKSNAGVDARFDDINSLAAYVNYELQRTGRGVVVANPIPESDEITLPKWEEWLGEAEWRAKEAGVVGRSVTPAVLGALHDISGGATLRANLALVRDNARVAAELCAAMAGA